MEKLRIGIIGAGGIAQTTHIPNLKKNDNVKIVAISDSDEVKAFRVAEKNKIAVVYEDPTNMINKENLNAVFVLTPTNLHYPVCSYAAKKGVNIFLEKPPVLNYNELSKLINIIEENKIIAMVGSNHRFNPNLQVFKEIVSPDEIGELLYLNIGWLQALKARTKSEWMFKKNLSGGGALMDLGIVLIDLMMWLTGDKKIHSIKATTNNIRLKKEVEDFASVYFNFENGVSGVMEMSWDSVYPEDKFFMKFYGTKGYASYPRLRLFKEFHGHVLNSSPEGALSYKNSFKQSYSMEVEHFINSLLENKEPISSLNKYMDAYKIIKACYQSAADNKEVFVENI
ncbi:MAG: Gfo/Idh/MocA family oxidoreductase [Calditrichia bacterium]|nr:Gfo/Idh/MocA family oxidoreductase [Calditrichia bacterium]